MKQCFKCGLIKPLAEFYPHPQMADGHLNKCAACSIRDTHDWYITHREHAAEVNRQWVQRVENKVKRANYQRALRLRHPEKYKARGAVANAIRDHRLERKPCEVCGGRAQAHHEDYSRPLDVRWLCFAHHRAEHGQVVN